MTSLQVVSLYTGSLAKGGLVTIRLTALGTLVALTIGLLAVSGRMRPRTPHGRIVSAYIELVRGTPQILQLFVIFFGLSQFRIDLSPGQAGFVWLSLYGGAYAIEIFRAGIESVERGQHEAAAALGLRPWRAMARIVIPQAIAVVLPALTSFLVLQLKAASLLFTIGVAEIMYQARLGVNTTNHPGVLYAMAAVGFLVMNLPLTRLGDFLERRVALYR